MAESPVARVRRALAVAARIADPADPLGIAARERLRAVSGLSRAGIALALAGHLETSATESELTRFVARAAANGARARPNAATGVVLSPNVCTAPLRAVAFALATSPRVWCKPSRRDPVIAELLAQELEEVTLCDDIEDVLARLGPGDELHLYGSDESLGGIASACPPDVVVRAHGHGFGVAVIGAGADLAAAAPLLASDLVAFDGRGCLSPRIALIEGDASRSERFAELLHHELCVLATRIPRGALDERARAELASYHRAMSCIARVLQSADHLVAVDPRPEVIEPAPAHRAILVVAAQAATVVALLQPWSRFVTCFGTIGAVRRRSRQQSDAVWRRTTQQSGAVRRRSGQQSGADPFAAARALCRGARRLALGSMQKPPFDGPVDLRF